MTSVGETAVTQKSQWVSFNDDATLQGPVTVDQSRKPPQLPPKHDRVQARPEGPDDPNINSKSGPDHLDVEPSPRRSDVFCWVQFDETPQATPPAKCNTASKTSPWKPLDRSPSRASPLHRQSSTEVFYEDISTSVGPPYTDWSTTHTDDATSENASGTGSADNSSFQEDEDLDMESVNWPSTVNGHPEPVTGTRFPSWVTFEDEIIPATPIDSPHKSTESPKSPSTPDRNSNSVRALKKRERPKSSLVDLSRTQRLDFSTLHRQLSLNSTPSKAPNPFLDEALKDVQPSPINPFSSFFEEQERRSQRSSVSSGPESSQRNSISILAEELDTEQFEDYRKKVLQTDVVEQLKQIQIEDPDSPGSPSLPDDPLKFDEPIGPTLTFTKPQTKEGWPMLLRIPEKKKHHVF